MLLITEKGDQKYKTVLVQQDAYQKIRLNNYIQLVSFTPTISWYNFGKHGINSTMHCRLFITLISELHTRVFDRVGTMSKPW